MAIITISRGTLSGGQKLAQCVAGKLGYRCISREEVLAEAAREYGVREEKLNEVLMKKPGVIERVIDNTIERFRYIACARAALCKEAQSDNVVYHGNAGHLMLGDIKHLIKIRVIAGTEYRIAAGMERYHLSREETLELIKKTDEERAIWTRFLYHVDWNDPSLYDLVIDLDQIDIDRACDTVCEIASKEEYRTTSESQKAMDNLMLGSKVRATLATHKEIEDGNLRIDADGNTITIWGTVGSLIDADRVRTVAWKVPGVEDINSRMRVKVPTFITGSVY